ncbi:MAG: hypothetical protein QN183_09135 [Armatimonadota bacterium]|nr:hypothetical protein [Armatimonadota bacterium]MDR7485237.1 hypothetical protein [Armatimonadota bacterium]MDR7534197.1 hypothetical protein [Armatimonadota bacterium]MDR7536515.1 hypothetical protein [Armatimonadota bacterium]
MADARACLRPLAVARGLALLAAAAVAAGCGGRNAQRLAPYVSPRFGFALSHPAAWHRVEADGGRHVWFLPQTLPEGQLPEQAAIDFLVVMTRDDPGPLPEPEVRRLAMSLLPMHGVSGFQRTHSSDEVAWYRFELTGATAGREWASVGLLVTGPKRLHYVVCAGALTHWRTAQKLCDEVLRGFRPGDLTR